jgi:serine/threonine protein kinase
MENSPLLPRNMETTGELGRSGDCVVLRIRDKTTNAFFAAKFLDASKPHTGQKFRNEIAFLLALGKDKKLENCVAHYRGLIQWDGCYVMVLDYVWWPTLHAYIKHSETRPSREAGMQFGYRLFWLLAYLQQQHRLVHRDVKPENIFINPTTGDLKLIDFGLAMPLHDARQLGSEYIGSPIYMAPEILRENSRAPYLVAKIDVFSAGMVLWELMDGVHPLRQVVATTPDLMRFYQERCEFDALAFPVEFRDILRNLLHFDFSARPMAYQALRMFK